MLIAATLLYSFGTLTSDRNLFKRFRVGDYKGADGVIGGALGMTNDESFMDRLENLVSISRSRLDQDGNPISGEMNVPQRVQYALNGKCFSEQSIVNKVTASTRLIMIKELTRQYTSEPMTKECNLLLQKLWRSLLEAPIPSNELKAFLEFWITKDLLNPRPASGKLKPKFIDYILAEDVDTIFTNSLAEQDVISFSRFLNQDLSLNSYVGMDGISGGHITNSKNQLLMAFLNSKTESNRFLLTDLALKGNCFILSTTLEILPHETKVDLIIELTHFSHSAFGGLTKECNRLVSRLWIDLGRENYDATQNVLRIQNKNYHLGSLAKSKLSVEAKRYVFKDNENDYYASNLSILDDFGNQVKIAFDARKKMVIIGHEPIVYPSRVVSGTQGHNGEIIGDNFS